MKKLIVVFWVCVLVIAGVRPAYAKIVYSVRVTEPLGLEDLKKDLERFSDFRDVRLRPDQNYGNYSLLVGVFQKEKDARLLWNILQRDYPKSRIVQTPSFDHSLWIPRTEKITLADLGWKEPILAQGFQAYVSFHFPWTSCMSLERSKLAICLDISPLLNDRSSIKVVVENVPLYNERTINLGNRGTIEVPLNGLQGISIGEQLDVELLGYFSITDDRCADEPSGNLWMVVDAESFLQYTSYSPIVSIRDYFKDGTEPFNIVLQDTGMSYVEGAIRLAGLIGTLSSSSKTRLSFSSFSEKCKNIFIGCYSRDVELYGSNLYVTPRGIDLVVNKWVSSLPFSNVKLHSFERNSTPFPTRITFEDLGQENKVMRGIGDLTASVPFSAYQIGGWPKRLVCTLVCAHTPVHPKERAFLKIKLNGALTEAREITGQGADKIFTLEIPVRQLNSRNFLEVIFSYYLNRGDCKGSLPEMEVTLFKDSFLSVYGLQKKPPLTIGSYPSVLAGKGAIVLSEPTPEFYLPMARLMELLANFQDAPPFVNLVGHEEYRRGNYDYAVMHLAPDMLDQTDSLVNLAPSFRIINPLTQKAVLELDSGDPIAAIQVFYDRSTRPVLVYSEKDGASILREDASILPDSTKGNVALLKDSFWYSMEVGTKLRVIYPHRKDMTYYWNRYRIIFLVASGTLILVFAFYVYRRLTGD